MSHFNVEFTEPPSKVIEPNLAYGRIQIGSFSELFLASLVFWTKVDYERHWLRSIQRIIDGQSKSCLITSNVNPKDADYIFWWPCYRIEDNVVFHNQILFFDQLEEPFDLENPYKSVSERETLSEDGEPISEWSIPVSCLLQFLQRT
jgi:hypothetical protein